MIVLLFDNFSAAGQHSTTIENLIERQSITDIAFPAFLVFGSRFNSCAAYWFNNRKCLAKTFRYNKGKTKQTWYLFHDRGIYSGNKCGFKQ